ncbi:MAG: sugar ABC transporter permease, partial [Devosia sp.]
ELADIAFQTNSRRGLAKSPRRRADLTREALWSYTLLSPFLIVYFVFVLTPILVGIGLSVMKWDGIHGATFIGFDNFQQVFTNKPIIKAFGNLFYFVALQVPVAVVVGLGLALFLDRFSSRSATILRAILLLPFVMPMFLSAAIWLWMMVPQFGLFNQLTSVFGLGDVQWLSDPKYMVPGLVIVETWRSAGFNMVLFYAGLKAIPRDTVEAARIDGANTFQEIVFVIMPQLAPITFIIAVNALLGTFQVFDLPWLLSKSGFVEGQGGAGSGLLFPVMQAVSTAFGALRFGRAAAISVILLILIVVATMVMFGLRRLSRRQDV